MDANKNIVVIAPHPDDDIIGCGGTIAKRIYEGYKVFIIFITDGRNHFLNLYGTKTNPTPEEFKNIRREEAIRALKVLLVPENHAIFMDYIDGNISNHSEELEDKLIRLFEKIKPIEVYFPREDEIHKDHRRINKITKRAITRTKLDVKPLEYSIFSRYKSLYKTFDQVMQLLGKKKIVYENISNFKQIKKMAFNEYLSQITIFTSEQKMPTFDESFLKRFDIDEEYFIIDEFYKRKTK